MLAVWCGAVALVDAQAQFPISSGKIVFHRYTDWTAWDGQLYIYDFATQSLDNISMGWDKIEHTTNAHFSPDGTHLVFMAVPKGVRVRSGWNIYVWEVGSSTPPMELLPGNGLMDQDPKYFPDGIHVTFKHNGDIGIVNTVTGELTKLTNDGMMSEKSMEYPTTDGKGIIYVEGNEPNSYIYKMDITTKTVTPFVTTAGVQNYYCIVKDDTSFLYARWASESDHADKIYSANMMTGNISSARFNSSGQNDSDPYPAHDSLVFFSSTRAGGKGGYDLWIGNLNSGQTRSLSLFGVNTSLHELGVCYTKNTTPVSVRSSKGIGQRPSILRQNYPNPFNPETVIEYELEKDAVVSIGVFDIIGKQVASVPAAVQQKGEHRFVFNCDSYGIPSGIYFYRVNAGPFVQTKTMVVIR